MIVIANREGEIVAKRQGSRSTQFLSFKGLLAALQATLALSLPAAHSTSHCEASAMELAEFWKQSVRSRNVKYMSKKAFIDLVSSAY